MAETIGMFKDRTGSSPFLNLTNGALKLTFAGMHCAEEYPGMSRYSPKVCEGSSIKVAIVACLLTNNLLSSKLRERLQFFVLIPNLTAYYIEIFEFVVKIDINSKKSPIINNLFWDNYCKVLMNQNNISI
jgi:hypothetical protein